MTVPTVAPDAGPVPWRVAMRTALYGPAGFFVTGAGPAAHFRTSANGSPALGRALLPLVQRIDTALGRPDPFDLVDVGAGGGELLRVLADLAPAELADRLRLTAVELAPRPAGLPAGVRWQDQLPTSVTGLLLATEWLDNVPLDVAAPGPAGWHLVLVDPTTGTESTGGPVDPTDARWLARWWPLPAGLAAGAQGTAAPRSHDVRAEIGTTRDRAWAAAVAALSRGAALTIDYGHLRGNRPLSGTLTGYRAGRRTLPIPDGTRDVTAHVAIDSVAAAGAEQAGQPYILRRQRDALRALGVTGRRPPLALAGTDPTGYVRALATATAEAELIDPAGLGGHWWLLQPVGVTGLDLAIG